MITYLRGKCLADGGLSRAAAAEAAALFGRSYSQIVSCAGFYSMVNGLPMEPSLQPRIMSEGELFAYGREKSWSALSKAEKAPHTVIPEIKASGLTGRGGGGFPVWEKWSAVNRAAAEEKTVICNVSEGEPGTCKDRALLLMCPETVIEGMAVCALAVGARQGFIYIRAGYEDAADSVRRALAQENARLGELKIQIVENMGAYVCGEETALLASLSGRRGEPARKPPYPTQCGFAGTPTVINNAETFAAAALALCMGSRAFAERAGRLYTVTGCGADGAVCELPLNVTARELFGAAHCRGSVKAFQLGGGASGSIWPERYMDISLNSAAAAEMGMGVGTGSIRFVAPDEDLRKICADIAEFFAGESCGRCTPCRFGCKRLCAMLNDGESGPAQLREMAEYIGSSSFCALGKSAGSALLSALRHFPEEFYGGKSGEVLI